MQWNRHIESSASESKPFQSRPNAEIQTSNANLKDENLMSSFGRLRQTFAPKGVPHVQHDFFLIQPIKSLLWGVVVAVTSSETATTTKATKTSQICIFDNEKQYFCTLCTFIFHFLTF